MDRPMELIQSSFSFSESAMKYMVSDRVESSKAYCLLRVSSAPLTVRQVATGMTPCGLETRVTVESLNQNSLPCFHTNQRRRQVLMYSPGLPPGALRVGPVLHAVVVVGLLPLARRGPPQGRHRNFFLGGALSGRWWGWNWKNIRIFFLSSFYFLLLGEFVNVAIEFCVFMN